MNRPHHPTTNRVPIRRRPSAGNDGGLRRKLATILLSVSCLAASKPGHAAAVHLERTPDGGIQQQALVDPAGRVQVVYFKGSPAGGDLFIVSGQVATGAGKGKTQFTTPVRVNDRAGSAVAVGTIRGPQIALGRNGRVHVVWNGSTPLPTASYKGTPLWYTRSALTNSSSGAPSPELEPQRDLMANSDFLDGGASVAADARGKVYVMWHGSTPGNTKGEAGRGVFLARSDDDGSHFSGPRKVNPAPDGVCACCGLKAGVDALGNLFAWCRVAKENTHRDGVILESRNCGETFETIGSDPWETQSCPMSSASILSSASDGVGGGATTVVAWETAGDIRFQQFSADGKTAPSAFVEVPGRGKLSRKHPSVAVNKDGIVLLCWAEGTAWQKGGDLAWQAFDREGRPTTAKGRAEGVAVWGLATVVALKDGSFLILY